MKCLIVLYLWHPETVKFLWVRDSKPQEEQLREKDLRTQSVAGVAALRDGRWAAVSTSVGLSRLSAEPDFLIEPTADFIGFASDKKISVLDDLLTELSTKSETHTQGRG